MTTLTEVQIVGDDRREQREKNDDKQLLLKFEIDN